MRTRAALISLLVLSGCFAKEWRPCHQMSLNAPTAFQKCFEWLTGPMGGVASERAGVEGCSGNCDCLDDPYIRRPSPELMPPGKRPIWWAKAP